MSTMTTTSPTWKVLAHIGRIPPEAWDAIVPHGPVGRHVLDRLGDVALNPQPLPPIEAAVGAKMVDTLLFTSIIIVGGRHPSDAFLAEIDDWCGTGWPKKWPRPKRRGEWDEGQLFAGAALAAASLAEQYEHDAEMQKVLGVAAERLAARAG